MQEHRKLESSAGARRPASLPAAEPGTSARKDLRGMSYREGEEALKPQGGGTTKGMRDEAEKHLDNDWAGRDILYRYLTGGGDWFIYDDADWTAYMKAHAGLQNQMVVQLRPLVQGWLESGATGPQDVDLVFPATLDNGEAVIGYQYLHGTNEDAGGFTIKGVALVERSGGRTTMRLDLFYTWNDWIDPNPRYASDQWKSTFAEVVTAGNATPYQIHIIWNEKATVEVEGDTRVMKGWPVE